jgi:uncharacterized protein YcaQ
MVFTRSSLSIGDPHHGSCEDAPVRAGTELSLTDARRLAIAAQGLAKPRPRGPIGVRHLRALFATIGTVQLDAINVLARTQFIVPFSRLGAYDTGLLQKMAGAHGELFEYWAHAACLLPMADEPLFRWRMAQHGPYGERPAVARNRTAWRALHADYIGSVLDEVRERGPLPASQLTDPRRRDGEWWERRSVGRQALESLFADGKLTGWRTANFERVYELPERAIPESVRARPTLSIDDAHDELLLRAARALGVATTTDLAYYYILNPRRARERVAALVAAGRLTQAHVEGWRDPAFLIPGTRLLRLQRAHATLLSPFDSLIWERARTRRLFGFDYTIEVYVPAPKRVYGYYVLPLLLGDRLVARFDLKSDRKSSTLLVRGAYVETGIDVDTVAAAASTELHALRSWLGLEHLAIAARGNLARALRAATRAPVGS